MPNGAPQATRNKRSALPVELESALMQIDVGQVTEPVRVGDDIVIAKLLERQGPRYQTYAEARPEMLRRLQLELLEKAKRQWLDALKGRTHVEVRL